MPNPDGTFTQEEYKTAMQMYRDTFADPNEAYAAMAADVADLQSQGYLIDSNVLTNSVNDAYGTSFQQNQIESYIRDVSGVNISAGQQTSTDSQPNIGSQPAAVDPAMSTLQNDNDAVRAELEALQGGNVNGSANLVDPAPMLGAPNANDPVPISYTGGTTGSMFPTFSPGEDVAYQAPSNVDSSGMVGFNAGGTTLVDPDPEGGSNTKRAEMMLGQGLIGLNSLGLQGAPAYYPGTAVAGLNPFQTIAGSNLSNAIESQGAIKTNQGLAGDFTKDAQGKSRGTTAMDRLNTLASDTSGATTSLAKGSDLVSQNPDGTYAYSNPLIDAIVDGQMLDTRRNLTENILPTLGANAAASGNLGSSRRAIAEGVAMRGLGEREAGLKAGLAGQFLNMEQGVSDFNANAKNQALNRGATAASSLGNFAMAGADLDTRAADLARRVGQDQMAVGNQLNAYDQSLINADMDRYNYNANADMNFLNNYMQMLSGGAINSALNPAPKQPSFLQQVAGLGLNTAGNVLTAGAGGYFANNAKPSMGGFINSMFNTNKEGS